MKKNKNILCTICARSNSKGVKNKNIMNLCGKPLIAYTIEQVFRWGRPRRVVVSTDSKKIRKIAKRFKAEAPFLRPARLSGNRSPKIPAIKHALIESEKIFNEKYDIVVDLDPTSPVRNTRDLENCLKEFLKYKPKTLVSVVRSRKNPYFNMVENTKTGRAKLCKRKKISASRRQDAPAVYSLNASIYFYDRDYLLKTKNNSPITDNSRLYHMAEISGWDIDTDKDFKFIEYIVKEGIVKL